MPTKLTEKSLNDLVGALLKERGADATTAGALASVIVGAERDGAFSHGLTRLPGYLSSIRSGWVNAAAQMTVSEPASAAVHVDAANGFAQAALARARELAIQKARANGVCIISIHNSHHFGCLWPDVELFAKEQLVAMAFVHSRSRIVAPGAKQPVLGTNPMAFGFPRENGEPVVWDQASSLMAHGDVLLAAKAGHQLPEGAGVDRDGTPSRDPQRVLDGGALLPFAGHKGFLIALLVEVLAAGMTGSRFGHEDVSGAISGAVTSNAGELLIVMDPSRTGGTGFAARVEVLIGSLLEAGTTRLPADRRYENRRVAAASGIEVSDATLALLQGPAAPR